MCCVGALLSWWGEVHWEMGKFGVVFVGCIVCAMDDWGSLLMILWLFVCLRGPPLQEHKKKKKNVVLRLKNIFFFLLWALLCNLCICIWALLCHLFNRFWERCAVLFWWVQSLEFILHRRACHIICSFWLW